MLRLPCSVTAASCGFAPVDCDDVFQCCAEVMFAEPSSSVWGQVFQLTGPEFHDILGICRELGNMRGRECKFQECSPADCKTILTNCQWLEGLGKCNEVFAKCMVDMCKLANQGGMSLPSKDVESLCGSEGNKLSQVLPGFKEDFICYG